MKICGISDIHGEFIDTPVCDVLCICGDIVGLNDQRALDASRNGGIIDLLVGLTDNHVIKLLLLQVIMISF